MDSKRCHEFMTTLQEDGRCRLTNKDNEVVEVQITGTIVDKALKIATGNTDIANMKMSKDDKVATFGSTTASEHVYATLTELEVKLAIQVFQQHFHILEPQKYTHPDPTLSYPRASKVYSPRSACGFYIHPSILQPKGLSRELGREDTQRSEASCGFRTL
ncbi:hypothetical protein L7F22_014190 [Adiantum nelumboides]|nr:hypothetical protein [Adiantum nelumboides]